jgi:hypothetical protein
MSEPSENPVNLEWRDTEGAGFVLVGNPQWQFNVINGLLAAYWEGPKDRDGLKALAQRLQSVLSGTGEAECPTNHKEFLEMLMRYGATVQFAKCPDCGRALNGGTTDV